MGKSVGYAGQKGGGPTASLYISVCAMQSAASLFTEMKRDGMESEIKKYLQTIQVTRLEIVDWLNISI